MRRPTPSSRRAGQLVDSRGAASLRRVPRGACRRHPGWLTRGQKKRACKRRLSFSLSAKKSRRRPTLPHGFPCSTIGSEELNFRVRDGIGCGLLENTTGNLWIAVQALPKQQHDAEGKRDSRNPNPARESQMCLRDMTKPHGLLVPVSSANCSASTPGLSTS